MRGFPHGIFCPCALLPRGPPGSKSCWDAAATAVAAAVSEKVDIPASEPYFCGFKLDLDSYGSSQDFETWFLPIFSMRVRLAWWFGLGSHSSKILNMPYFQKYRGHTFGNVFQTRFRPRMFSKGPNLTFPRKRPSLGVQLELSQGKSGSGGPLGT